MKKCLTLFAALLMTLSISAQTADYEIVPIKMNDLAVTPMDGFELLEASYPDMKLSVKLGVYADGHLSVGSTVIWDNTNLPIVEGTITKAYSNDLGTNAYTGLLVVEFGEGLMGLQLTMYTLVVEVTEIDITNAEAEVNDLYGHLLVTATWENYPVLLTIHNYKYVAGLKEYEGPQVSELNIGDEDNWYDYAVTNLVTVINENNTLYIEGEYISYNTGKTYYVTMSAPASTTDIDNVATSTNTVKVIKNGQLIINKNGVEYNAQGATVK